MENQPHREPATPEQIWKILRAVSEEQKELSRKMQETDRQIQETNREITERQKETDRQMKETNREIVERQKETDRQMKETDRRQKETDRLIQETAQQQKETDRQLKKTDARFNSQWGKLMESLVEGDLVALLQARGVTVERTLTNAQGTRNGHHYEFDILAVNGEEVVVVEVKTTLRSEDVARFLEKLADYTTWAPEHKGKQILGAVAYLKADSSVAMYAERQGLYVIRATGSSAAITNQEDFHPRVFH